jgi:hypothetical protein
MSSCLLFLPDISGFTKFVQTTEISHSQHIIAELLELLIASNNIEMTLAEIEGDALFFYRESLPTKEELEGQIEKMLTVFYSHLHMLQKNRICPCKACISAPELELKIIAHCGEVEIVSIRDSRKPFGPAVIQAHRLMKNSVESDRYLLISEKLATEVALLEDRDDAGRAYVAGQDTYDDVVVDYLSHTIEMESLHLIPHAHATTVRMDSAPTFVVQRSFPVDADTLLEHITNYGQRPRWTDGLDAIEYNEDEVTRLGTQHTCVINDKRLNFTTVTLEDATAHIVYGELTTSVAPLDRLYLFYLFTPTDEASCSVEVEAYIQVDSWWKKPVVFVASKALKKSMVEGLERLEQYVVATQSEAPAAVLEDA